eukprot:m.310164 g.310164  ORF g.310164 m.310164 type:complete len:754 (+) comp50004_c0_seq1:229-2490(+)
MASNDDDSTAQSVTGKMDAEGSVPGSEEAASEPEAAATAIKDSEPSKDEATATENKVSDANPGSHLAAEPKDEAETETDQPGKEADETDGRKKGGQPESDRKKAKISTASSMMVETERQDDGSWEAVFGIDGKCYKVNINDTRIVYWPEKTKSDKRTGSVRAVGSHEKVLMTEILGAKPKLRKIPKSKEVEPVGFTVFSITNKKRKWREKRIHFDCADIQANRRWSSRIEVTAKSSTPRPRRMKIFINPAAGKKHGIRIFQEDVLRVFSIAEIRMERDDVTVTDKPGHIADVLREIDLDCYDGVVVVGGDGSVNELIDGLLRVTCQGVTPDLVNPCDFRIGIIPTGTNNTIASSVYGTVDPLTSAFHIVLGQSHSLDVLSVAKGNKILRFGINLGYGFPAEVIFQAKKHTWFGKVGLSALPAVRHHKRYPCEVHYLAIEDEKASVSSDEDGIQATNTVANWKAVKGTVAGINVAALNMASESHPDGLWPDVKDRDGLGKLVVVEECSRTQLLNYNLRFSRSGKKPDDFDFVSSCRVRVVRLRPLTDRSQSPESPEGGEAKGEAREKEKQNGENARPSPIVPAIIIEGGEAEETTASAKEENEEKKEDEEGDADKIEAERKEKAARGASPASLASTDALLNSPPRRSPQSRRRGLGVSLRQRLATFSVRGSRPVRKHTVKQMKIKTTAAGDTLVRKQAAQPSMPLPPGGPSQIFDESWVKDEDKSIWAVDGEPVKHAFVDIRIHSNLIKIFGGN